MDDSVRRLYVMEIEHQCEFARFAYGELTRAVGLAVGLRKVFFYAHALLTHCANVSKLLSCGAEKGRAKSLRGTLQIPDDSPILGRKMRSHFEHFDERLDKHLLHKQPGMVIDSNVMPRDSIRGGNPTRLRNLDPRTLELTFLGDSVNLTELYSEVLRIRENATEWLEELGRVPPAE